MPKAYVIDAEVDHGTRQEKESDYVVQGKVSTEHLRTRVAEDVHV